MTIQTFLSSQEDALCEIDISDRIESAINLETGEIIDPASIDQEEFLRIEALSVDAQREY
jgi:hypothetical protein